MLSPWNLPSQSLSHVELEDDTLREGLQCGSVAQISIEKMQDLLRLSSQMGVTHSVIGFPVDDKSRQQVESLLATISSEELPIRPWILARFHQQDIQAAMDLNTKFPRSSIGVALFKSSNPQRARIEGWPADHFEREAPICIQKLNSAGIPVSLNFEDATRTPPECFTSILKSLQGFEVESWALCDTVGCATPEGAKRLVSFFLSQLNSHQSRKVVWHGHNDLGLAFANSLAALDAGASVMSGTFLGIGERAGNLALEQMLAYLYFTGEQRFGLSHVKEYSKKIQEAFGLNVSPHQPLLGDDVFLTHAGTHASAMIKAVQKNDDYKDLVFQAFAPSLLGRESRIKVGPLSGKQALHYLLTQSGVHFTEQTVSNLGEYLKLNGCLLDEEGVRKWLQR